MAIFGRKTARQRLRRATRESLTIPAFSSPIDCTPWVIGGLWPAELATVTPENASAAESLRADLQRIVESANEEVNAIRRAVMPDSARQAEETRVINAARGFAVSRVESTVRYLYAAAPQRPTEHPGPQAAEATVFADESVETSRRTVRHGRRATAFRKDASAQPPKARATGRHAGPEPDGEELDADANAVFDGAESSDESAREDVAEPDQTGGVGTELAPVTEVVPLIAARDSQAAVDEAAETSSVAAEYDLEAETERLCKLLNFLARQEPGLRWAVGRRGDGTTMVVTDLAHGWIPPGITLPAGVCLLDPDRRSGTATALLGPSAAAAAYAPGNPLGWAIDTSAMDASLQPRELPMVDDLGWVLSEATRWRDGLPRMVHTLARAGAAGTGVLDAEVDVLRVHLDTARYQLLAQYPDVDAGLLLNCLLLAATEGIATGDRLSANYHFAWFQKLDTPPASKWTGDQ